MIINVNDIQGVYLLGIGGIGMSALARYFHSRGFRVAGYDRTPSQLTEGLIQEGIEVTYTDSREAIVDWLPDAAHCLVIRTPAVPQDCAIYTYLREEGYQINKRAEVLGVVTRQMRALCVAGTHGKTTTSTLLAHLLYQSEIGTNAFLGGISNNYRTNLLLNKDSSNVVIEADEYDRSFHQLTPYMSIITNVDPDHLDIYGTPEAYREGFEHYSSLIKSALIVRQGLPFTPQLQKGVKMYTYAGEVSDESEKPDFYAENVRVKDGNIYFDFVTPNMRLNDLRLGVPVWVNIENSVAAMAVAWLNGVTAEELRTGLSDFSGIYRRFNVHVQRPEVAYVDDYAHHPTELRASIESIRRLFPERRLMGVFQPHLYTRTRDFAEGFRQALALLDEQILLPIYPARELPIEGVSSEMLLTTTMAGERGVVVEKSDVVRYVTERIGQIGQPVVVLTVGAGDIDRLVPDMTIALKK